MGSGFIGQPAVMGRQEVVRMILLNFGHIGTSFTWSVEMTYGTPYLLSLGLSKSTISLVWLVGPLSGLVVQPIVGIASDESTSPRGRRRPFMVLGSIVMAVFLLVLGFIGEVAGLLIRGEGQGREGLMVVLAVCSIYVIDVAINIVASCSRSLVVDTLSIEKQQTGMAWAGRMGAVGHLIGYCAGAVDLPAIFGHLLGDTQIKALTSLAALSILLTTAVTCYAVTERVLVVTKPAAGADKSSSVSAPFAVFRQVYVTMADLSPRVRAICWAQFWTWLGWFPFLCYSTTWVGEIYFRYDAPRADAMSKGDVLGEMGRIGSLALVIYSCITFACAFFLPLFVRSPDDDEECQQRQQQQQRGDNDASTAARGAKSAKRTFSRILDRYKPDLLTAWMYGHLIFSGAMFLAPLARSFVSATVLICICGLPWTIILWAPSTFLGIEINKLSEQASSSPEWAPGGNGYGQLAQQDEVIELPSLPQDPDQFVEVLDLHTPTTATALPPWDDPGIESSSRGASDGELSGIYLAILNVYTTLPQFIGTFASSIVFAILDPGSSPELAGGSNSSEDSTTISGDAGSGSGPNAISVDLFLGALATVVAFFVTRKLRHL